ncbi:hypothetical protein SCLCIDRAFT_1208012 [Scleroderma citrinum Foug A]|uniref:Uncharacterized protein n=1 Tax=Scleroderma citrinum Foug A TaxID=1036808 RepID=A0A0C3E9X4_9AGAM|nr:hypothetical protein SCLCIDRAFT_1208012 [Scleroderma citrinum Foug A]
MPRGLLLPNGGNDPPLSKNCRPNRPFYHTCGFPTYYNLCRSGEHRVITSSFDHVWI